LLKPKDKKKEDATAEGKTGEDKKAETAARLEKVKSMIAELKTEEGIYQLPRLVDQISYLYNMLGDTDQLPGQDVYERYEELMGVFTGLGE